VFGEILYCLEKEKGKKKNVKIRNKNEIQIIPHSQLKNLDQKNLVNVSNSNIYKFSHSRDLSPVTSLSPLPVLRSYFYFYYAGRLMEQFTELLKKEINNLHTEWKLKDPINEEQKNKMVNNSKDDLALKVFKIFPSSYPNMNLSSYYSMLTLPHPHFGPDSFSYLDLFPFQLRFLKDTKSTLEKSNSRYNFSVGKIHECSASEYSNFYWSHCFK
jgi:hypothetical protein